MLIYFFNKKNQRDYSEVVILLKQKKPHQAVLSIEK